MIYPVGDGTKETFDQLWYVAQGFGNPTTYGLHEGLDINLKTGGDTDLGQPLLAIANGQRVYYHNTSHPTTGFGRHQIIRIDGSWGTRWVHYAHNDSFNPVTETVTEKQEIGKLGKSGTTSAHLHFAIWKVDPVSNGGIDSIAHNQAELDAKWEEPFTFINQWSAAPIDYKKLYEEAQITINDKNQQITNLQNQVNDYNYKIARFKGDTKNFIDSYQI